MAPASARTALAVLGVPRHPVHALVLVVSCIGVNALLAGFILSLSGTWRVAGFARGASLLGLSWLTARG